VGVREFLWLAIALLAVYVAVQLYRELKVGAGGAARPTAPTALKTAAAPQPARSAADPGPATAGDEAGVAALPSPRAVPPQTGPAASGEGFQLELETQQLRRDIAQLRAELGEQRKELAELAARVRIQQEQLDNSAVPAGGSPEYDQALVFARRGFDVETIAERCGITVAEAALVRSLAQRGAGEPDERP
jgi:hypothetical protein